MIDQRVRARLTARFWGQPDDACRELVNAGAHETDFLLTRDRVRGTTLVVACTPEGIYAVERLLERGVVVRVPDVQGRTTSREVVFARSESAPPQTSR